MTGSRKLSTQVSRTQHNINRMNRAKCMKEMKSSLEKGLNDDLPENKKFMSPFLIHVEYYLNIVLSPFIALMVTKTVLIKFKTKTLCHDC